uniref:Reverse transcriptase n=1 Tax=Cannabis sativa TaxID=3483 RepID=A0A803PVL8_CANSA
MTSKLMQSFFAKDVKHALFQMDPSKSPDEDGINRTLICLIPKIDAPSKPSNFMPISLCNVLYKIITKVMTNRLGGFGDDHF